MSLNMGQLCQEEAEFVGLGLAEGSLHIPCRRRQLASLGLLS